MMGERMVAQEALFYGFSIERHVPANHLLRSHLRLGVTLSTNHLQNRTSACG
jgi:hypothetical protein